MRSTTALALGAGVSAAAYLMYRKLYASAFKPGKATGYDAVVYGAGPVGAAVALGLQQHGHRVCVREKRTEHQVVIDAGKSINLSLSTRGVALLEKIGAYADLKSTLIPMVSRRFSDGSTENYREPLLSINRNEAPHHGARIFYSGVVRRCGSSC
jgi:2-polyprenyl-6-methoxyphenol hydroxylase-like FAD-dependent oxidoreductase